MDGIVGVLGNWKTKALADGLPGFLYHGQLNRMELNLNKLKIYQL